MAYNLYYDYNNYNIDNKKYVFASSINYTIIRSSNNYHIYIVLEFTSSDSKSVIFTMIIWEKNCHMSKYKVSI